MNKRNLVIAALALLTACAAPTADPNKGLEALRGGDYQTALDVWQPLAEQGDPSAQTNLGTMYSKGDGVPQNDAQAVEWFRKAAEQDFAAGQYSLGFMYAEGKGVPRDYVEAYAWFALAATQKHENSRQALDYVVAQMNEPDIISAQRLTQEYYNKYARDDAPAAP